MRHTAGDGERGAAELHGAGDALEAICRDQPDPQGWNGFQLRRTLGYAAQGMLHLRRYDDSVRCYDRIEELGDELQLEERVWRTGAVAGRGDVPLVVNQLRDLTVPRGRRRQALDAFHRVEELKPLARHEHVASILAAWR